VAGRRAAASIALCVPATLGAQRLAPSAWREATPVLAVRPLTPAFGPAFGATVIAPHAMPGARIASAGKPSSPEPYLAGGALVGALTVGLVMAHRLRGCEDCTMVPLIVVRGLGLGTAAGLAGGGFVYLVRRASWTPAAQGPK
jgi:hypothetical protein